MMKKLLFLLSILFLFGGTAFSQNCNSAQKVTLNRKFKTLPNRALHKFTPRQCGYLYICDPLNTAKISTSCRNGKFTKVNKSLAGCNRNAQDAFLLEANQTYHLSTLTGLTSSIGQFAFVADSKACKGSTGGGSCKNAPSNCREVSCTPRPNGNRWDITGRYSGSNSVSHWTINNRRQSNTTKTCTFKNYNSGTYDVCVYYKCGNKTYKCCKKVVCKPTSNKPSNCCNESVVNRWLAKELAKECSQNATVKCCFYNGKPVIDVDRSSNRNCTDPMGTIYDCQGKVIKVYGGIGGIRKPNLTRCKTYKKPKPDTGNCTPPASNCKEITCTPKERGNKWDITSRYTGSNKVTAWYVNRQRQSGTSKVLSLRGKSSGTYYICAEYKCGNKTYTCCKEVVCKPSSTTTCKDYADKCNYVKCSYDFVTGGKIKVTANYNGGSPVKYWTIDGKRYNNRTNSLRATIKYPKKHRFYVICYYECNRRTYKCGKWVYLPT